MSSGFVRDVRPDFPILKREIGGKRLVYLDSAATSQKPSSVIEAVGDFYANHNANVHRGAYALAEEATAIFEGARTKIAGFLGAPAKGIVFTKNASEAVNLVAYSWGGANVGQGDKIVVTLLEHHSNIIPWYLLAERTGAEVEFCGIDGSGHLDLEDLEGRVDERTRMVAVTHVSNTIGTINPVAEIASIAHAKGALCLVDGAQAAPHMPVDVNAIGCDFYVATGHKMCAPTGIGVLWARPELLEEMPPFLGGGEMIANVTTTGATWAEVPYKFEAGTPPIGEAAGLGAAVDYLESVGIDEISKHEHQLVAYAFEALSDAFGDGIKILGPQDPGSRGSAMSFVFHDVHPHDLATILDQEGVAIRAGHHCAKPLMTHLGLNATARASFYIYNTEDDVDALVRALGVAGDLFHVT
ncbi:MAG: cysteine desulfurase [Acidobacteria bacterium]|nr:MAG: cysteine desulfurase [Acidobacteriota bacterium]